jgi:hypothetical protein
MDRKLKQEKAMGQKTSTASDRIALAKKCLRLISQIAGRGACSQNPEHIGYALQELSQVLLERTGNGDRLFEPVPADQIHDLGGLYTELEWVNGSALDLMRLELPAVFGILPVGKEQMA